MVAWLMQSFALPAHSQGGPLTTRTRIAMILLCMIFRENIRILFYFIFLKSNLKNKSYIYIYNVWCEFLKPQNNIYFMKGIILLHYGERIHGGLSKNTLKCINESVKANHSSVKSTRGCADY